MKNFYFILFTVLVFVSCSNDNLNKNEISILTTLTGERGLSYNESIDKWTELKKINGNSYVYQTTFISWTGSKNTTEIKVKNGKVTSRIYQGFIIDDNGNKAVDSFIENSNELGNHLEGAEPLTIDELYTSCASDYLIVDQKNNTLYFETDTNNGLITLCGFVPNGCADDCYRGIRISSFTWID